ncbi:hypothetical protein LINPERHAP1_LOCUS37906, partial [Linum perenne]
MIVYTIMANIRQSLIRKWQLKRSHNLFHTIKVSMSHLS